MLRQGRRDREHSLLAGRRGINADQATYSPQGKRADANGDAETGKAKPSRCAPSEGIQGIKHRDSSERRHIFRS